MDTVYEAQDVMLRVWVTLKLIRGRVAIDGSGQREELLGGSRR
jgi:hypothetical protein